MNAAAVELSACIATLERLLEKAKLLAREYEQQIRSRPGTRVADIENLPHAMNFSEVRSLDCLCLDALEKWLPDYPHLAKQWSVNQNTGFKSPEGLIDELVFKRTQLLHALALADPSLSGVSASSRHLYPEPYSKLEQPINLFFTDTVRRCENYEKNVFIMTRFQPGNRTLEDIDDAVRDSLAARGLVAHRSDDRVYPADRNLWDNVCTYMFCCKYGIAILEDIISDEFNPNVALEYGFMRALGKSTLLLKEVRFEPRADIIGTLWEPFDILDVKSSIASAVNRWLNDLGL
jgi:hypothetical protein